MNRILACQCLNVVYVAIFAFLTIVYVPSLIVASDARRWSTNQSRTTILPSSSPDVDVHENTVDTGSDDSLPSDTLAGVYSECILGLSFACLQRKLIAFLYELDRMERIPLVGESVVVVRKGDAPADDTSMTSKIAEYADQTYLKEIIDGMVDKFFDNHWLRVAIPRYADDDATTPGENDKMYLDIDFRTESNELSAREGRRRRRRRKGTLKKYPKFPKKVKLKGLKKFIMLVGLMTCLKLAMMAPVMLGMIGLKAMKALILSVMAITIHKMMMLQKFNLGSLISSAHDGWSSATHGSGWDRNINEVSPPASPTSTLPYYIEPPPSVYSSHKLSS